MKRATTKGGPRGVPAGDKKFIFLRSTSGTYGIVPTRRGIILTSGVSPGGYTDYYEDDS